MLLRTFVLLMTLPLSPALFAADEPALTVAQASHFAALALKGISKEYPNKLDHVIRDAADVQSPRALHPAFYGCFDWHSSVHGHWMLVRLLKTQPGMPEAAAIRSALRANLTKENLAAETSYLKQPGRASFERTYGWAWLLKLAEELHGWNDPDGREWSASLAPLAEGFVQRYLDFLPKQTYPIRTGVHPNTAFGLAFALDYARTVKHGDLEKLIVSRSRDYFGQDANYPASWEPGGEDFLSAALMEADLMRRVLPAEEFGVWFRRFLPEIPASLLTPATVTDRTDPKIVHLDGLNLSRAACLWSIAKVLPASDPLHQTLTNAAGRHAAASLPHVTSGDYAGEHWLASFAVWMNAAKE
ncbi:MAG TPA: DUF2891 domain-containing protein [Verrucomicrobiales bacterium]|jgi:hypothetical protein|nr:DUF2891 domain-containing protein [Verrucomicrobiales bacterium]